MPDREPAIAVLVDYENMARPGVKGRNDFDIELVLSRLADKGRVLVKRAYADWSRYRDARHALINAGLELIEMPSAREGAKNRADIKMAVDAMELVYSRVHLDNFVLVSGDSDFTPLVGKLRELNKRVIGVGNRESASDLLIANCDEFIFYDTIAVRTGARRGGKFDPVELMKETLASLHHEGTEQPLASVVKDSMRRKAPAFDEGDIGFATFTKFLEDAGTRGIVKLERDEPSGTYRVSLPEEHREAARGDGEKPRRGGGERNGEGRRRRGRRGGRRSRATTVDEATKDDGEHFEFVVKDRSQEEPEKKADPLEGLPPIDQPISYEHVVMLSPEISGDDADDTDLAEVSDSTKTAEEEPGGTRRRRRRSTSRAKAKDETPEAEAAPASEDTDAKADETPDEKVDEPTGGRRRRRIRRRGATSDDTPETGAEETPTTEAEEKPKRKRAPRKKATEGDADTAEAEEKPKRKRVPRTKKAEDAPADDTAAADSAGGDSA